jgi:diaminohydroxyphosphoribosylaminopyrimidine deaminase/5-amino-6-(5-phosphoribosylamino)uracil reductase
VVLFGAEGKSREHQRARRLLEGRSGFINPADRIYLARAIELAARASGDVAPNPPVGAVLVRGGRTIGEGWHRIAGSAHAEVEALRDADARGESASGATAYVSLEPCNHHGRTPPCTEALLAAGVKRVVIAALDPNPKTSGGGVARLRDRDVDVIVVDELPAAQVLIQRFRETTSSPYPYITLKMAMSLDGAIAPGPGMNYRLTGDAAFERVRMMRSEADAVMVGAGTIRVDDAQLTIRPHRARRKPYTRIVVCETDPVPAAARVFAPPADAPPGSYARTIVLAPGRRRAAFASLEAVADLVFVGDGAELDLDAAMRELRARGVVTILCEGGPTLGGRLLEAGLVRELVWFIAPLLLQTSTAIPPLAGADLMRLARGWRFSDVERVGNDLMLRAYL